MDAELSNTNGQEKFALKKKKTLVAKSRGGEKCWIDLNIFLVNSNLGPKIKIIWLRCCMNGKNMILSLLLLWISIFEDVFFWKMTKLFYGSVRSLTFKKKFVYLIYITEALIYLTIAIQWISFYKYKFF